MLPNPEAPRALSLDERKGLLWLRKHQPAPWPPRGGEGLPNHATLVRLLQGGFIKFDPHRKRFDPVAYVLTEAGEKALQP